MIAVDGSDGLVMGSGIRCGCPVLLKSFPDICDGAIAGVRILVKSGLINLGPHVPWPQINQAGNVGTLGARDTPRARARIYSTTTAPFRARFPHLRH